MVRGEVAFVPARARAVSASTFSHQGGPCHRLALAARAAAACRRPSRLCRFGVVRPLYGPCSSRRSPAPSRTLVGLPITTLAARSLLLPPRGSLAQKTCQGCHLHCHFRQAPVSPLQTSPFTPRARRADFKPGIASPLHALVSASKVPPSTTDTAEFANSHTSSDASRDSAPA